MNRVSFALPCIVPVDKPLALGFDRLEAPMSSGSQDIAFSVGGLLYADTHSDTNRVLDLSLGINEPPENDLLLIAHAFANVLVRRERFHEKTTAS